MNKNYLIHTTCFFTLETNTVSFMLTRFACDVYREHRHCSHTVILRVFFSNCSFRALQFTMVILHESTVAYRLILFRQPRRRHYHNCFIYASSITMCYSSLISHHVGTNWYIRFAMTGHIVHITYNNIYWCPLPKYQFLWWFLKIVWRFIEWGTSLKIKVCEMSLTK